MVFGIPDSGFFVDHINLKTKDNDYKLNQKILFEIVNKEVLPESKECLNDNFNEMHNCLLAENIFKYIKVPILMLQPGYHSWQLYNILGENCVKNNSLIKCEDIFKQYAHSYKDYQNKLIDDQMNKNNNLSAWSPSCINHCYHQNELYSPNWEVPQDSGNTINSVVKEYLKSKGKYQVKLIDKCNWPDNKKCSNL